MLEIESPVITIRGGNIGLGPIRRDLLPLHVKWANDPEVTLAPAGRLRPSTLEDQEAWYQRDCKPDDGKIVFLIYELATLRPIGATRPPGSPSSSGRRTAGARGTAPKPPA